MSLLLLDYGPKALQPAFHICNSATTLLTPSLSDVVLIQALVARCDRRAGVGTVVALRLPYTILILLSWFTFFCVWMFVLAFAIGPDAPVLLNGAG